LERKLGSVVHFVVPETEPERDDSELARAFRRGEPWAARAIWTRHAPMVFRLLERALGPNGEADDLTQNVFLSTFAGLSSLRDPAALRSFIYSVALRMLKWELRRRRVRRIVQLSPAGVVPEVPVRAADSESREILLRFYALLDRLSANERTAFVLRHMEELKLEEVAEHLGVSLATAKRWISRGSQTVSALVAADPELSSYLGERGVFDARG
jgi:RNA polymerase sigma-70 factor, ECF subfamily